MRLLISSIMALLLLGAIAPPAHGDGKAFRGRDNSGWRSWLEQEQRAYISCDGATQRMLVAIRLEDLRRDRGGRPPATAQAEGAPSSEGADRGLWLVPVRAPADVVRIDLVDALPRLHGIDPRRTAADGLATLALLLRAMQLWPVVFDVLSLPSLGGTRGVEVGMSIDRFGLRAEVIAAQSPAALLDHLAAQGARVGDADLASFQPYFDGRHSIVAVWIASPEAVARTLGGRSRDLAIGFEFPSAEPWYPMRATGGYGEAEISVTLYVAGLHRLAEQGDVRRPRTRHFRQAATGDGADVVVDRWAGRRGASGPLDYTVITLDEPATRFTADVTFAPNTPRGWRLADSAGAILARPALAWSIAGVVVLATLASAGAAAAKLVGQPAKVGAAVGLLGVLTLVAPAYVLSNARRPAVRRLHEARFKGSTFLFVYSILVAAASLLVSAAGWWFSSAMAGGCLMRSSRRRLGAAASTRFAPIALPPQRPPLVCLGGKGLRGAGQGQHGPPGKHDPHRRAHRHDPRVPGRPSHPRLAHPLRRDDVHQHQRRDHDQRAAQAPRHDAAMLHEPRLTGPLRQRSQVTEQQQRQRHAAQHH